VHFGSIIFNYTRGNLATSVLKEEAEGNILSSFELKFFNTSEMIVFRSGVVLSLEYKLSFIFLKGMERIYVENDVSYALIDGPGYVLNVPIIYLPKISLPLFPHTFLLLYVT
jgi:hypothetical protein